MHYVFSHAVPGECHSNTDIILLYVVTRVITATEERVECFQKAQKINFRFLTLADTCHVHVELFIASCHTDASSKCSSVCLLCLPVSPRLLDLLLGSRRWFRTKMTFPARKRIWPHLEDNSQCSREDVWEMVAITLILVSCETSFVLLTHNESAFCQCLTSLFWFTHCWHWILLK